MRAFFKVINQNFYPIEIGFFFMQTFAKLFFSFRQYCNVQLAVLRLQFPAKLPFEAVPVYCHKSNFSTWEVNLRVCCRKYMLRYSGVVVVQYELVANSFCRLRYIPTGHNDTIEGNVVYEYLQCCGSSHAHQNKVYT